MGRIRFKNNCEHSITTWLIAGPSSDLSSGEEEIVNTEAIWYSGRAKGPGNKIDEQFMRLWKEELYEDVRDTSATSGEELNEQGTKIIIRQVVASMYDVFNQNIISMVEDDDNRYIYKGCSIEGIYGGKGNWLFPGIPNIGISSEIEQEKIYDKSIKKHVTIYKMKMNF